MINTIISTLESNPTFTKGDLILHLSLPTDKDSLREISYGIWKYNHSVGRKGYYSLTTTI